MKDYKINVKHSSNRLRVKMKRLHNYHRSSLFNTFIKILRIEDSVLLTEVSNKSLV